MSAMTWVLIVLVVIGYGVLLESMFDALKRIWGVK